MSILRTGISDLNQPVLRGIPANENVMLAPTGRADQVSGASAFLDISVRAQHLSSFAQRVQGIADQMSNSDLSADLLATGSLLSDKFARGVLLLFSTLEKFAEISEELAGKETSLLSRFLRIARDFTERALDSFNDFMGRMSAVMQSASGADAPASASASVSAYMTQVEWEISVSSDGTLGARGHITLVAVEITVSHGQNTADPLVLDLNGNGTIDTTGIAEGAAFDINGDGTPDESSFVTGGDAFLAFDLNGNGAIDSQHELFGDAGDYANGFAALADHDANADGVINALDPVFDNLELFYGYAGSSQVTRPLATTGVAELDLSSVADTVRLRAGDFISDSSAFTYDDGTAGLLADVMLTYV